MPEIMIDSRFNGLPGIALGGYVGGILARGSARAEVTLRGPVRLGRPYGTVRRPDGSEQLRDGDSVLAVAQSASIDIDPPGAVSLEDARTASELYVGRRRHEVPMCFVCGPARSEGDGLRIFPGPVAGRPVVAAPWTPASSLANSGGQVGTEFVWSALDCPSIWALIYNGPPDSEERAVTVRLAVEQVSPVIAGDPHVIVGWKAGESGGSRVAGGAIYSTRGRLLARARHTLVTTDWGVPMGLNRWRYGRSQRVTSHAGSMARRLLTQDPMLSLRGPRSSPGRL